MLFAYFRSYYSNILIQMSLFSALTQCLGIPLSFLSLALASVKLFYSQRLGRFREVDPSPKMIAFLFTFFLLQITGPLFNLVLLASYFKGHVILFVAFVIVANFFVLNFIFDTGNEKDLEKLYEIQKNLISDRDGEQVRQDSKITLTIAVLTSWITTGTVWSNNFSYKSYFLLMSSITSTLAHMICLSCIYIYTALEEISSTSLAPITHCFLKPDNDLQIDNVNFYDRSVLNLLNICHANESCLPNQRLCSQLENSTDLFYYVVGPIGFSLLVISLLSSVCLQFLGNYSIMYSWSRKLCCCLSPIIHASFLQDAILNNKIEFLQEFDKIIKTNPDIVNQKDPLHGDTPMMSAAKANSFELLKKMILLNGNTKIINIFGQTVEHLLEAKVNESEDQQERRRILDLLELCKTTNDFDEDVKNRVWTEQPMHEAVSKNRIGFLCFLHILGGQWGAVNLQKEIVLEHLSSALNSGPFEVSRCNAFVKWCLSNATDQFGQSLLLFAARQGNAKCLNELLKTDFNVNARCDAEGHVLLHSAVQGEQLDCLRILIEHGSDVNVKAFSSATPLHYAARRKLKECAQLLIDNGADVNALTNVHQTPLHCATINGQYDIMKLLIEKGANVNVKNTMDSTIQRFIWHLNLVNWIAFNYYSTVEQIKISMFKIS